MCEYCEEPTKDITFFRQDGESNIKECFVHVAKDGAALFIRQNYTVKFDGDGNPKINHLTDLIYANIKYCPMCGRKLEVD